MTDIIGLIKETGLLPAVKLPYAADAVPLAKAFSANAIMAVEILLRTSQSLDAVKEIRTNCPETIIGAGTVTSVAMAQEAIDAGAMFIVLPGFNAEIIKFCIERHMPVVPGCVTACEILSAMSYGLEMLKFFPAALPDGPGTLKLYAACFPDISFVTTGGVTTDNFTAFLDMENVAAAGGDFMTVSDVIDNKDWQKLYENIKTIVKKQHDFKVESISFGGSMDSEAGRLAETIDLLALKEQGAENCISLTTRDIWRASAYLRRKGIAFTGCMATEAKKQDRSAKIYVTNKVNGSSLIIRQK